MTRDQFYITWDEIKELANELSKVKFYGTFGCFPAKQLTNKIANDEASVYEIEVWLEKVPAKMRV